VITIDLAIKSGTRCYTQTSCPRTPTVAAADNDDNSDDDDDDDDDDIISTKVIRTGFIRCYIVVIRMRR